MRLQPTRGPWAGELKRTHVRVQPRANVGRSGRADGGWRAPLPRSVVFGEEARSWTSACVRGCGESRGRAEQDVRVVQWRGTLGREEQDTLARSV